MIIGLGIDLLENSRVERELARGDWLEEDGIFTREEIRHCNCGRRPAQRFACCFAAKEATLKAMNARTSDLGIFRLVEVEPVPESEYRVVLHGRAKAQCERLGTKHIKLAVAHSAQRTAAMVILEA